MSEWAPKRFWTRAEVAEADGQFTVTLDGRPVRSPAKAPLRVPTRALAQEIASEWQAQKDRIDPATMPFTRMANSAIDKVTPQHAEVAQMLAAYGDSDLLCYRADHPTALVARQTAAWDPVLYWAAHALGAQLAPRKGVMHAPQDPTALAVLAAQTHALDPHQLAGFHDLVSLSGSLVLAFAVTKGQLTPDAAWDISRLDELWQAEQWGADDEAEATAAFKRDEFQHAERYFRLAHAG